MANLINAKCPNCGAVLELPDNLDRAFCFHCGGKVIIGKDETHYHTYQAQKTAIACPECRGKGYFICNTCKGSGRCIGFYNKTVDNRPYYSYCKDGKCPRCQGGGKQSIFFTCSHCKGTGRCPTCNGFGRCVTCRGGGRIMCPACKGSGFKVYRGD